MKYKLACLIPLLYLSVLVPSIFAPSASAATIEGGFDVYVDFNVTATSCFVNTPNIVFDLYNNVTDLEQPNSSSEWQESPGQVIRLTNCFNGTHSVEARVSGIMDRDDKDGFKNQESTSDAATGISVQLKSGNQILHDQDLIETTVSGAHSVDIPLAARVYSTNGNTTAGMIYTVINLELTYK